MKIEINFFCDFPTSLEIYNFHSNKHVEGWTISRHLIRINPQRLSHTSQYFFSTEDSMYTTDTHNLSLRIFILQHIVVSSGWTSLTVTWTGSEQWGNKNHILYHFKRGSKAEPIPREFSQRLGRMMNDWMPSTALLYRTTREGKPIKSIFVIHRIGGLFESDP